jgi:uncharacterized protein
MNIISHDQAAHRFTTKLDGYQAALDYTLAGGVMNITHTGVPAEIGGRGVAADLMQEALKTAQAQGWTVKPVCSYAVAYMRKREPGAAKNHMDDLLDEALDESFPASDSPSVGGSN